MISANLKPLPTRNQYIHQTCETLADNSILINDIIYGEVLVSEPLLVELINCKAMQRLNHILQHGITAYLGIGVPVTRLEHSIGAMLLIKYLDGSLVEQTAALLHDISHTAMSHVVDYAFDDEKGSFHEAHKKEYLKFYTDVPKILAKYGLDWEYITEESNFPLLEQDSPKLCADRLDYALRDAIVYGSLTPIQARKILNDIVSFPNSSDPTRIIAVKSIQSAKLLEEASRNTDTVAYSDPIHVAYYLLTARAIKTLVKKNILKKSDMWCLDDQLWYSLCNSDQETSEVMQKLKKKELSIRLSPTPLSSSYMNLKTKIRIIDPDVVIDNKVTPISFIDENIKHRIQDYVAKRKKPVYGILD